MVNPTDLARPLAARPQALMPLVALGCLFIASGCSDKAPKAWSGYVEGDYIYVAAPLAGRLNALSVQAGQTIAKDAPLFTLDAEAELAARDEAQARVAVARAQAANTDKGRRSDEIAVTEAQLAQAQANAAQARNDLARQQQLVAQGFVSKARIDDASAAVGQAQARVAELTAALRVARLPARADERNASQASAVAASEALRQTQWRASQKVQLAPEAALVADTYFRPGEFVPAGQPVLALLPPQNIKARFYVPEAEVATLSPGQAVTLSCDGCGAPLAAHIVRIATQAEYTPPVIYSNAQRAKLVFLVEGRLDKPADKPLHPGQPLDVRPVAAAKKP